MSISTDNVPSYAKWPTVGVGIGVAAGSGALGLNLVQGAEKSIASPKTVGLKVGALSTLLIFDALALKDMHLPKDRNLSGTTGAGVGALMLGGTAGAAKWMFTSKDDLGVYANEGEKAADVAKRTATALRREVGSTAFYAAGAGILLGAAAGAIFAGKGGDS